MSRSRIVPFLLLAAGPMLTACSDRPPSGPGPLAAREVTFDRESAEGARGTVVVGIGNPAIDVPAVQAAVDQGGDVVLRGHFSFDAPATKPVALSLSSGAGGLPPAAEVLIANAVSISGMREEDGSPTTIERGTIPFYVDAPGQSVTFRGLHFHPWDM